MKLIQFTKKVTLTDHVKTGYYMRTHRISLGLSLREVARRLKMSPPYVSDLELGKRNWSQELMDKFNGVLK